MLTATNKQAISASSTASGMLPPAYGTPTMMENATAAAGAMWVMDWNRVGASPTAFRSSRCASTVVLMSPSSFRNSPSTTPFESTTTQVSQPPVRRRMSPMVSVGLQVGTPDPATSPIQISSTALPSRGSFSSYQACFPGL